MEWKEELAKKSVQELRKIAGKLAIPGRSKLGTREALLEGILACPENEIIEALEALTRESSENPEAPAGETGGAPVYPHEETQKSQDWDWRKKVAFLGSLASIIGICYSFYPYFTNQCSTESLRIKIQQLEKKLPRQAQESLADPLSLEQQEEFKRKLLEVEQKIKELQGVDPELKKEALEAFRKENFQEAEKLAANNPLYLNEIGTIYQYLGKYQQAKNYFEKALAIDLKNHGSNHPDMLIRWNNLGSAYDDLGQYDKAIKYYERALRNVIKNFGKDHNNVAVTWNNLGGAYKALGQYDKAIQYVEKALTSDLKTYGKEHPDVALDWNNLGSIYYEMGDYQQARGYLEKALAVRKKTLGDDHPYTKGTQEWLDLTLAALKK